MRQTVMDDEIEDDEIEWAADRFEQLADTLDPAATEA